MTNRYQSISAAFLFGLGLSINAAPATAESTICQINGEFSTFRAITWDTDSREAHMVDMTEEKHSGRMVYSRNYSDIGEKINFVFEFQPELYGTEEAEFIVFPDPQTNNGYRMIGAGYIRVDGERFLDVAYPSMPLDCISL